jgi:hypothetical protein
LAAAASVALLAAATSAWGDGRAYSTAYDYPGTDRYWVAPLGTLSEPWLDFGESSAIPSQQGVDYPISYRPEAVGFGQGAPAARRRLAHSQYEFFYGSLGSCLTRVFYPCSANLFSDRFEADGR